MSDEKCGNAMWNDGVVHVEYGGVKMRNVVVEYREMWNGLMAPD